MSICSEKLQLDRLLDEICKQELFFPMTNWQYNPEEKSGVLAFEGEMTIHHVSDIKERLLEAFSDAEQVTLDVSATTSVDVAGIQLLCACLRFSNSRGKKMNLLLGENTMFSEFLDEVGFSRDFICT